MNGEEKSMTRPLSRRAFVVASGAAACAVMFASSRSALARSSAEKSTGLSVNHWVTLYADGTVDIISPGAEMGQGTSTALPRLLAEELDADWSKVRSVPAPADEKRFGNPLFWNIQVTAGSRTCLGYFDVLRVAGGQARHVLLLTAAEKWRVSLAELETEAGSVLHPPSGRAISYARLVATAKIPSEFPKFVAPGELPQVVDDFFGEPPPSQLLDGPDKAGAIRLKSRDRYRLIGKDTPRLDLPAKIDGSAEYGIDASVPGMMYATVVTAPVMGDIPDEVDSGAVLTVPGVMEVILLPYGVAIVGTHMASVLHARDQLTVRWKPGPRRGRYDSDKIIDEFAAVASRSNKDTVPVISVGDAGALQAELARPETLSFELRSELIYHAPIEPQNATVRIAPDGKGAEVWVGTQWPQREKEAVAKVLGIQVDAVTVYPVLLGGSFGRRQEPGAVIDAAYLAKHLGKPVKVIWSREEDLKRNPFRQAMVCRVDAAADGKRGIGAIRHRIVADSWFAREFPDWFALYGGTDPGNWSGALTGYDIPLQSIETTTLRRDVDICYFRGIGVAQVKFAQESLIELAAHHARIDPLEFRRGLLAKAPRGLKVLEAVATASEWQRRRTASTPERAVGLAYTPYSNAHSALVADVSLNRETGELLVHEVWCAIDVGLAAHPDTVSSQIEGGILQGLSIALFEQVVLREGVVQHSGFVDYPLLRLSNAPKLHVQVIQTENPMAGAGEIGTMQIAPAINSALLAMRGIAVATLPMNPENVLKYLQAQERISA